MTSGSVSGWQAFALAYFLVLLAALLAARVYRRWVDLETVRQFEELMRRRASLYELLKILAREFNELGGHGDDILSQWLAEGPTSRPEGQALRDVDIELEILQDELAQVGVGRTLADPWRWLTSGVDRARAWIAGVVSARTVGETRAALAAIGDEDTRRDLVRLNDWIRHFARQHGIKEQNSFYHDSYFYV
ncbi:MAG: hypothetical protein C4521_12575 [Actinobacteria bacterium]|jgi:hypothetical protein|nr:MAG: hypothetical protein C4521_12575 [Actinomycetota bacterium]